MASSCVWPDQCIVVIDDGNDWCTEIVGAKMWPPGHPEFAEPVLDGDEKNPRGCRCFNVADEDILGTQDPVEKFDELFTELQEAARANCNSAVPDGWTHNCYDEGLDSPAFILPFELGVGSCVGDCAYTAVPKAGCGRELSPQDCEDEFGAGETGSETGTGGQGSVDPVPTVEGEVQWQL